MRQLREVLRLRLHAEFSMRQIRDSLRISLCTIQKVINQAGELGLDLDAIDKLDDQQPLPAKDSEAMAGSPR